MDTIQIKDKCFRISITEDQIQEQVRRVASCINKDYEGRTPLFLAVLNGSFIFAADLLRSVTLPCDISFVKLASYQGTSSTGKVREVMGLDMDIAGREVIVVEDIVDTGLTMAHLLSTLRALQPASLEVCTLLLKPGKLQADINVKYCCLQIPDDFIVGYGLDYDGQGRNTRSIYTVVND